MALPPVGLHIISELYECKRVNDVDRKTLDRVVSRLLLEYQLTKLGTFIHEFEGGGITALFGLAESHIAVHTWPELTYVTLEVYVCNHTKDNTASAQQLHMALLAFFEPERYETRNLNR